VIEMNKKLFLMAIIMFLSINVVIAEEMIGYTNQPTTITTACIRNFQMRATANASIIIYDAVGGILVPKVDMNKTGNGTSIYTYNFTTIGSYSTRETCDFGDYLADGSTAITILNESMIPERMNYDYLSTYIWSYANRTVSLSGVDMNNIAFLVWSYANRNLTYYPEQLDMTDYNLISNNVWSHINRTLTTTDINATDISNAVWNAQDRNLTFYPSQSDMTDYSLIGFYVWNQSNRNLTFYQDVTNYTLISNSVSVAVWNYAERNLTYYPMVDLSSISMTLNSIDGRLLSVEDIVNDTNNQFVIMNGVIYDTYNLLQQMNQSLYTIYNYAHDINASVVSIQADVTGIYQVVLNINGTVTNISANTNLYSLNNTGSIFLELALIQQMIQNQSDYLMIALADISYFSNENESNYYEDLEVETPSILETQMFNVKIKTIQQPLEGDTFRLNYQFFEKDTGDLIKEFQTTIKDVGNHKITISSDGLEPEYKVEQKYNVWVRVEMLNGVGLWQSFPLDYVGELNVVHLNDNGPKAGLYDVIVTTLYDTWTPAEPIRADITILNTGDLPDQDTVLTYWLEDTGGNKYGITKEQFLEIPVGTTQIERAVTLPLGTNAGQFQFKAQYETVVQPTITVYDSVQVSDLTWFEKVQQRLPVFVRNNWILSGAIFIVIMILLLILLVTLIVGEKEKRRYKKSVSNR